MRPSGPAPAPFPHAVRPGKRRWRLRDAFPAGPGAPPPIRRFPKGRWCHQPARRIKWPRNTTGASPTGGRPLSQPHDTHAPGADAPSIPVAAPHPAPGRHDTLPRCADVPKDSRPPVSALPAASFMTRTAPPQERQAGATSGAMPAAGPAATGPKAMDEKKPLSVLIAQGRGMSMVAGGGFEPPTFGL